MNAPLKCFAASADERIPTVELLPISPAKRALDVGLSAVGLVCSSPLWLLVAAAVKLEDGGPVLYRQRRVGLGGRVFDAIKFRSMIVDAERTTGVVWAKENDPRVTRIGRVLRATATDELPQLWNILKGDMSFVGPRPERPEAIVRLIDQIPNYHERHRIQPGLTGLAQVYRPYDAPDADKLIFDLEYIERRCFWLDLKLIALSFWITFRGRWEARGKKV
ncbi:MAG: sugar transferase [Nitrospirae bacterium]|nr:sugar transferase [Nitrospirota bacterium]